MTLCVCVGGWRGERGKIIGVKGVRKRKTGESEEGGGKKGGCCDCWSPNNLT